MKLRVFGVVFGLVALVLIPSAAWGYFTNMSADVVVGQQDFSSSGINQGGSTHASTLQWPYGVTVAGSKLIIPDYGNSRVLIYNQIPTSNNASADVVIGQQDFTSSSADQGGSAGANTLRFPIDAFFDGTRLFIADSSNARVLIYNSIPTTNNVSADVVVGQVDFTGFSNNQGGSAGANTISAPWRAHTIGNKLFINDVTNDRVLIYNSIPTTNNTSADVVIGQQDFTSVSDNQGGSAGANTMDGPIGISSQGTRLFLVDSNNNRLLIYNSIPTSNNTSADIVLGQADFTSNGAEVSAHNFDAPIGITVSNNQLFVAGNNTSRVLIFTNLIDEPDFSLDGSVPELVDNNLLRLSGSAKVEDPYVIRRVEYSVNGGGFLSATPSDGNFDEISEDYFFDYDPEKDQPRDESGMLIPGYTVRARSVNSNVDITDNLFFFQPFDKIGPVDNATVSTAYPEFTFGVNRQRLRMSENLDHYQVQVRQGDCEATTEWNTLIDEIPVDFEEVKDSQDNLQRKLWGHLDTRDGVWETDELVATYSREGSQVKVRSKKGISGTHQWRMRAVDKSNHPQESGAGNLYVNATSTTGITNHFPLAILNISGLGNPQLNSYNPTRAKGIYFTNTASPTFYGIAWSGAEVTLKLSSQGCSLTTSQPSLSKSYTSTANADSRYGINIPRGELVLGKKYTVNVSVAQGSQYNQLPQFTLVVGSPPIPTLSDVIRETITPTTQPTPTPTPTPESEPEAKKRCFLFFCF